MQINGRYKSPAYAITSRPKEYSLWTGPGPNAYDVLASYKQFNGPAFTMGSKHKHLEIPAHPVGPNQYNLPNTIGNTNYSTRVKTAPKYTMSSRHHFNSITYGTDASPSRLYNYDDHVIKPSPPKYTMAGKFASYSLYRSVYFLFLE